MTDTKDPYCYAGTDVLKNLADCRDQHSLNLFEAQAVAFSLARLSKEPINQPFGLERLKETHRRIFGGVYPWAGEFRENTGTMAKPRNGYVVHYADSAHIERTLRNIFGALAGENQLQGLSMGEFAARLGHYYGEIDAVHPFREGNSRTLRHFTADLARSAGYKLDWSLSATSDKTIQDLFSARDLAVVRGDSSRLADIVRNNIVQTLDRGRDTELEPEQDLDYDPWDLGR